MSSKKVCAIVVMWSCSILMACCSAWVWRDAQAKRESCEFRLHVRGCIEDFGENLKPRIGKLDYCKEIDSLLNDLQISIAKYTVFSFKTNIETVIKSEVFGNKAVKNTSPSVAFETNGLARAMRMARLSVDSMYGEGSFDKGFEDMRMDRMLRKLKMNVRLNADTNLTLDVSLVSPVPRVYLTTHGSLCD